MSLSLRNKIYNIVDTSDPSKRRASSFNRFIIFTIIIDAISMIAATQTDLSNNAKIILKLTDVGVVAIYTFEHFLRTWACIENRKDRFQHPIKGRIRHLFSLFGIIDTMAILPFYLKIILGIDLTLLRPFRVFKMLRYSTALSTLTDAIKAEKRVLESAGIFMLILLIFISTMLFYLEKDVQPEKLRTIQDAFWWGIVTITTVGYGDIVPVTEVGRVLGGIATMMGFCMFAIPAGVLASTFAQEAKKRDFVVTWNLVARMPLLSQLDAAVIAEIASVLKPKFAGAGEYIVKEGDVGRSMYFIVDGSVEVRTKFYPVRLRSGSFFGEMEMLEENKKRNADVLAIANTQLLMLEAEDFHKILDENPEIEKSLRIIAKRRQINTQNLANAAMQ
ncbi:MAG: cyclic nucleotide-gated ion channel [Alphaproteobacteria bacterium]